MHYYWFALGILCVWRITHLLQAEDGPLDLVVRLRRRVGEGLWGKLLDCFYCLSLWVAVPFACLLGDTLLEQFLLWPAFSTGAIILERVLGRDEVDPPAPYIQYIDDKEDKDGMLRTAETTPASESPDRTTQR